MDVAKNNNKETAPDYLGHRERLRARFLSDLGRTMPDYELLELILTFALPRRDVKPLAKALLRYYYNLANVLTTPPDELMKMDGVGRNTALLFAVIHAAVRKICWENLENRDAPSLTNKKELIEYCRSQIGYKKQEHLMVIYLDIHGKFLRNEIEQIGTIGAVLMDPRTLIEKILLYKASKVILVHNHPSGDCTPSKADIDRTKDLKKALQYVNVELQDHLIISSREAYSMKEHLPFMNMS